MLKPFVCNLRRAAVVLSVFQCFFLGSVGAAEKGSYLNSQNPIVGTVEKHSVRLQSLEDKKINDLRKQLYEAISRKLKLDAIRRLGKSYPQYAAKTKPEVTDREIADFYQNNKLASKGTLKELAPEIRYYMERLKMQQLQIVIDGLYREAVKEGLVTQHIRQPNDFLVTVPIETGYVRNRAKSRVMLLEFSDYQCPACRMVQPVISQLRVKYDRQVLFAYRHFPLSFHTEADEAAISVECGREQGKFESLHQYLFANQTELSLRKSEILDYLKNLGGKLGIENRRRFARCVETEKYRDLIENDIKTGLAIGIGGTPAFIVGRYDPKTRSLKGELMTGGLPLASFESLLKKYM